MDGKDAATLEGKNGRLGRRGAFFHCVHSAFLLTASSHTAGKKPKCHSCSCYWQLFSYHQREFIAPLTDAEIQKLELKAKGIESENRNANK